MGRLRYVHGTVKGEDERMIRAWQGYIAQMRSFDLRPGEFMELGNILTRGLGGSWGASGFMPWKPCEQLEARFWAVYNLKFQRVWNTPRLSLYGMSKGRPKVHFFEVGAQALWRTATRAMAAAERCELRDTVRAAFAEALHSWGCRVDPAKWDGRHVAEALQRP